MGTVITIHNDKGVLLIGSDGETIKQVAHTVHRLPQWQIVINNLDDSGAWDRAMQAINNAVEQIEAGCKE